MKVGGSAISFSSVGRRKEIKKNKIYYIRYKKLFDNTVPSVHQESKRVKLELKILKIKQVKGITTRSKDRWQEDEEKVSNCCCNLEKNHYTEKSYPNLLWRTCLR